MVGGWVPGSQHTPMMAMPGPAHGNIAKAYAFP